MAMPGDAEAMNRVLMILSAADQLILADGTDHPTGFWAEEVVTPHRALTEAGVAVDVATPAGRRPTVDPLSLSEAGGVPAEAAQGLREYLERLDLSSPLALADVDLTRYAALLIPGGHAPMADLAADAELGALLRAAAASRKPVAALCHGVAALLSAQSADGTWLYAGRALTAFSDEEERQGGHGDRIPFSVERRLRERGAVITPATPWSSKVVVDGTLITGQNPQSSAATAAALLSELRSTVA
jgi:putative intracellular protease/amidase